MWTLPALPSAEPLSFTKLDANESPDGCSPRARSALRGAVLGRYPDRTAGSFRAALAATVDLPMSSVGVGAGSTLLIDEVVRRFVGPGGEAVMPHPSFVAFSTAVAQHGGRLRRVPMGASLDLDALTAAVGPSTRLVYLPVPNNPTGATVTAAALRAFLQRLPRGVRVLLDEAYRDYALGLGLDVPDGAALVREGWPVLVLRTFSKAHGLPAARVGWVMGSAGDLAILSAGATPYPLTGPSMEAAFAALADRAHVARVVRSNAAGLIELRAGLQSLGFRPAASGGNFVYLRLDGLATPLVEQLAEVGVLVRDLTPWGDPQALRVTVGRSADHARLFAALRLAQA